MSIICRLAFTYSFFIYFIIVRSSSNETINYVLASDGLVNANASDVVKRLENHYNYTVYNGTAVLVQSNNNAGDERSTVMKIDTPAPRINFSRPHESVSATTDQQKTHAWISTPLTEGLRDFRVRSSKNPLCQMQSDLYETHLKNQTLWAVRMYESSQIVPTGIIGGNNYQMGNFEECIKTKAYGVRGQYCLANFKYSLYGEELQKYQAMVLPNDFRDMNHESSVWEALIRLKKDPVRIDRQNLYWALCFPASCSPEDLEESLNRTLLPKFIEEDILFNITVDPIYCHTNERKPFTTGFYITISFMALLLFINIISTALDGYECLKGCYSHEIEGWRELIGVFSLWRNIYNLGIYNKESQVKIVNGVKVVMMFLIIYGHCLLYILGNSQFNPASLEEVYRRGADVALVNTNIVDAFFTVSGFITFYYGYHPMKVGGVIYLVLSVFFRYLRLIPVFAIVIAYVIYVLPYTSDGPIWDARIGIETENCRKNWWLDLLLLNTFINVDEQCVLISWYITTDMLLCILASILIYIIVKNKKVGMALTVAIFMSSVVITFMVTYKNHYNGLLKLYMTLLENPRKSIEFKELYVAVYSRAGPYLVGFLGAFLTVKLQEINYSFSWTTIIIGGIVAIAIGEGSQYYGVVFYKFDRPYNLLENALYSCLHRVMFAGLFSWGILAYLTSGFGILNSIVNHRIFTVFGRITYSVFLMNTLSLITLIASIRTPIFYSYKMILFLVLGDVFVTYVLGFMFYLYAEAPLCGISKLLQKSLTKMFAREIEEAKANAKGKGSEIIEEKKHAKFAG